MIKNKVSVIFLLVVLVLLFVISTIKNKAQKITDEQSTHILKCVKTPIIDIYTCKESVEMRK